MSDLLSLASSTSLWALNDRSELPALHENRVVLLGDICHPMLLFMVQGAAMATIYKGAFLCVLIIK